MSSTAACSLEERSAVRERGETGDDEEEDTVERGLAGLLFFGELEEGWNVTGASMRRLCLLDLRTRMLEARTENRRLACCSIASHSW